MTLNHLMQLPLRKPFTIYIRRDHGPARCREGGRTIEMPDLVHEFDCRTVADLVRFLDSHFLPRESYVWWLATAAMAARALMDELAENMPDHESRCGGCGSPFAGGESGTCTLCGRQLWRINAFIEHATSDALKAAPAGPTDLFGRSIVDPMRAVQLPLFHEPVQVGPPPLAGSDARIARQYDPAATMRMFPDGPPGGVKKTLDGMMDETDDGVVFDDAFDGGTY